MEKWLKQLIFFSSFSTLLISQTQPLLPPEDELAEKISSHLLLEDYKRAEKWLKFSQVAYPYSKKIAKLEIEELSKTGQLQQALERWKSLPALTEYEKRHLLEEIAWGMILKGEEAKPFALRYFSLLGAFFTRDTRATFYLQRALRSSNALLRSIAVQMSSHYRDPLLIEELSQMIYDEKNQNVRYLLVQAIGELKIRSLIPKLQTLLSQESNDPKMQACISATLTELLEDISEKQLVHLLSSPHTSLRFLGVKLIAHLANRDHLPELLCALDDCSIDIRLISLCALAQFPTEDLAAMGVKLQEKLHTLCEESNPYLSLTSAWLFLRLDPEKAEKFLEKHLFQSHQKLRLLTAGALTLSGDAGVRLMQMALQNSKDDFVRVNCAYGLLALGESKVKAADQVFEFLKGEEKKLMIDQFSHPLFHPIAPSTVHHSPGEPRLPEVVDQKTRLSLIGLLANAKDERAESLMKRYLLSQNLQVGATAMVSVLREGSIEGVDIVKGFLQQSDPKLRLQSALALAFLWEDPTALQALKELYPTVPYETKLLILEAIAGIAGMDEVPFLLERMEEPFFVLRVAASSVLIQALRR